MELIDKSAIVTEIERRIKEHHSGYLICLKDILYFLDTLEVKEVDLEKEIKRWKNEHGVYGMDDLYFMFAKHFFQLGLKVQKGK